MRLTKLSALLVAALAIAVPNDDHEGHEGDMTSMVHGSSNSNSTMDPSPVSMHGGHHHGRPILDTPDLEPQQRAYWEQYDASNFLSDPRDANKSFLKGHIVLTIMAWCFLFPLCVCISGEEGSRAKLVHFVLQTLQSIVAILALFFLAVYAPSAPADLYPGNLYGKVSIAMFFIVLVHWSTMAIRALSQWALVHSSDSPAMPLDGAPRYRMTSMSPRARPSDDSGHAFQSDSPSSSSPLSSPVLGAADARQLRPDEELPAGRDSLDEDFAFDVENDPDSHGLLSKEEMTLSSTSRDRLFGRIMKVRGVNAFVLRLNALASLVYTVINKPLFVVSFFYFMLGVVTFYRMGLGNKVFNVLAHVIKGGVFFLFGLLTLARYCGAFASHGMAWNLKPSTETDHSHAYVVRHRPSSLLAKLSNKIPSMEFIECLLIFIYGVSNVGLEHLGNSDGAWSHKDLQHASIAFMYIGGGLCGLLVETTYARRAISSFSGSSMFSSSSSSRQDASKQAMMVRSGYSFNPIAAFTVFWTGVLMSKHAQELPLSTEIHQQWGVLLCVAAIFRLLTYIVIYLSAPNTTSPTRPFTELVTSFCLICGGMVFIQSNGQTVEALIYRGLDSMFSLNVNVGCAVLIMSYEMVVWSIKSKLSHV